MERRTSMITVIYSVVRYSQVPHVHSCSKGWVIWPSIPLNSQGYMPGLYIPDYKAKFQLINI